MKLFASLFALFYTISVFAKPVPIFWTPRDRLLYQDRHFIELEHRLIMANHLSLLKKLQRQEEDLAGCRELHHGRGGVEVIVKCMEFLNREDELGLFTRQRVGLVRDISILCRSILPVAGAVEKMIASATLARAQGPLWQGCNDFAWQQVYLTTYANFEAKPVEALAFFRRAEIGLRSQSPWAKKTKILLEKLPMSRNP